MARRAFDGLPEPFRALCGNVNLIVAEIASREICASVDIDDPMELTGLFDGIGLPFAAPSDPVSMPNAIYLFRKPIIAEWRATPGLALRTLITHVLVHEIAHHFGYSDEEIHAIEEAGELD